MSGENCLIVNWNGSREAPGTSFSRVPKRITNDEDSINWRNNIVAVIDR